MKYALDNFKLYYEEIGLPEIVHHNTHEVRRQMAIDAAHFAKSILLTDVVKLIRRTIYALSILWPEHKKRPQRSTKQNESRNVKKSRAKGHRHQSK